MRIFVLPKIFTPSLPLTVKGNDFHYLIHVLRLKKDNLITGRDSNGKLFNLKISSITKNSCTLETTSEDAVETTDAFPEERPDTDIILYICVPKGAKMKQIVKMATETGVINIIPVYSKNCIPKEKENLKNEKWETIIKEAVQQSGSVIPTTIESPIPISNVPSDFTQRCRNFKKNGIGLFFHQKKVIEDQKSILELFKSINFNAEKKVIGILIGSEGGLTSEECFYLCENSFNPILLKTNILRTETAVVYAISSVQSLS